MTRVAELDAVRADVFWEQDGVVDMVKKYERELDGELRDDMTKLATYLQLREAGVEATFANMRACRRACGTANVDRHFNESARRRMYGMGRNMEKIVDRAKKAGINTQGKYYVGGLGRYTDKHAWVSTVDDILHVAKQKNLNVNGAIRHKAHKTEPAPKVPMASDVMQGYVRQYLQNEPKTAEKVKRNPTALGELKERILHKHSRRRKKANGKRTLDL